MDIINITITKSSFFLFIALIKEQFIINPKAYYYLAWSFIENPVALDHIVIEQPLKHLAIGQFDVAFAVLWVVLELAIIVYPLATQLRKILVVEVLVEVSRFHVVNSSLSIELIVFPMAFISNRSILVIKFAEAMHFILLPLSLVVPSVFEV